MRHFITRFGPAVLGLILATAAFARDGKGDHHHHQAVDHPITTKSAEAQRLFGVGLGQAFGFNHDEAAQSFRRATESDPECAMCWWGVALVLGPNINFPMVQANHAEVVAAIERARALAPGASPRERAYIEAVAQRYSKEWTDERAPLDLAYAKAMRRAAYRYPDDLDLQTLFAEALMDTTPWDYWLPDNSPKQVTEEFLGVLETVLRRAPDHPGAAHYMVHAVEKARPELGVPAADRLAALPQATGHLRHMASHIYIRVGRYHDASRVNQEAIAADRALLAGEHQSGVYSEILTRHNVHFLWAASSLEGRGALALETARELANGIDETAMLQPGMDFLQHFWLTPLYALVRFGRWDEVLAYPEPAPDLLYPRGIWHYSRGLAWVRRGELERAEVELEAVSAAAEDERLDAITISGLNTTRTLMRIARGVLGGELAAARGDFDGAVAVLEEAAAIQDRLVYDEPPPWHQPVRHVLGAVLLAAGRPAQAAGVYREDLEEFPHNGWSLFGLAQSLEAQGKSHEAKLIRVRFETAWQHADTPLVASRL